MRLIDADKLADYITENEDDFIYALEHKDRGLLETMIALIPTAYNIDKVVEELEEWSINVTILELHNNELREYEEECKRDVICTEIAMDIIKAGGKNE